MLSYQELIDLCTRANKLDIPANEGSKTIAILLLLQQKNNIASHICEQYIHDFVELLHRPLIGVLVNYLQQITAYLPVTIQQQFCDWYAAHLLDGITPQLSTFITTCLSAQFSDQLQQIGDANHYQATVAKFAASFQIQFTEVLTGALTEKLQDRSGREAKAIQQFIYQANQESVEIEYKTLSSEIDISVVVASLADENTKNANAILPGIAVTNYLALQVSPTLVRGLDVAITLDHGQIKHAASLQLILDLAKRVQEQPLYHATTIKDVQAILENVKLGITNLASKQRTHVLRVVKAIDHFSTCSHFPPDNLASFRDPNGYTWYFHSELHSPAFIHRKQNVQKGLLETIVRLRDNLVDCWNTAVKRNQLRQFLAMIEAGPCVEGATREALSWMAEVKASVVVIKLKFETAMSNYTQNISAFMRLIGVAEDRSNVSHLLERLYLNDETIPTKHFNFTRVSPVAVNSYLELVGIHSEQLTEKVDHDFVDVMKLYAGGLNLAQRIMVLIVALDYIVIDAEAVIAKIAIYQKILSYIKEKSFRIILPIIKSQQLERVPLINGKTLLHLVVAQEDDTIVREYFRLIPDQQVLMLKDDNLEQPMDIVRQQVHRYKFISHFPVLQDKNLALNARYNVALLTAAQNNNIPAITELLAKGAGWNGYFSDSKEYTVHCMLKKNNIAALELAKKSDADFNIQFNAESPTPLITALVTAAITPDTLSWLLEHPLLDLHLPQQNKVPLIWALQSGHSVKIMILLQHRALILKQPLALATILPALEKMSDEVLELLAKKLHADQSGQERINSLGLLLSIACKTNRVRLVQYILGVEPAAAKIIINEPELSLTPMRIVVKQDHWHLIEYFVPLAVDDVNRSDYHYVLLMAVNKRRHNVIKWILDNHLELLDGAKFSNNNYAIHTCLILNDLAGLRLLQSYRVNVNSQHSPEHATPLIYAITIPAVKLDTLQWLLLQPHLDFNKMQSGKTPLQYAAEFPVKRAMIETVMAFKKIKCAELTDLSTLNVDTQQNLIHALQEEQQLSIALQQEQFEDKAAADYAIDFKQTSYVIDRCYAFVRNKNTKLELVSVLKDQYQFTDRQLFVTVAYLHALVENSPLLAESRNWIAAIRQQVHEYLDRLFKFSNRKIRDRFLEDCRGIPLFTINTISLLLQNNDIEELVKVLKWQPDINAELNIATPTALIFALTTKEVAIPSLQWVLHQPGLDPNKPQQSKSPWLWAVETGNLGKLAMLLRHPRLQVSDVEFSLASDIMRQKGCLTEFLALMTEWREQGDKLKIISVSDPLQDREIVTTVNLCMEMWQAGESTKVIQLINSIAFDAMPLNFYWRLVKANLIPAIENKSLSLSIDLARILAMKLADNPSGRLDSLGYMLFQACKLGCHELVPYLLALEPKAVRFQILDDMDTISSPIRIAAENNHWFLMASFPKIRIVATEEEENALQAHGEVLLTIENAEKTQYNKAAHLALVANRVPELALLLGKNASLATLSENGDDTVHHCIDNNNIMGLELLAKYQHDINQQQSPDHPTPLTYALQNQKVNLVTLQWLLLRPAIDLNKRQANKTPLEWAANHPGKRAMLELMLSLQQNADIEQTNPAITAYLLTKIQQFVELKRVELDIIPVLRDGLHLNANQIFKALNTLYLLAVNSKIVHHEEWQNSIRVEALAYLDTVVQPQQVESQELVQQTKPLPLFSIRAAFFNREQRKQQQSLDAIYSRTSLSKTGSTSS